MKSKGLLVLLCLMITSLAARSGLRAIDFGTHWDEGLHLSAVTRSTETGNLLPERYLYPSLTHAVMLGIATVSSPPDKADLGPFKLRARVVLFFISLTTLLALWALASELGWGAPTAAMAVCLLVSSWEFIYHSRWIAPDMLLAPFALASLAAFLRGLKTQRFGWWAASAVAAGLCCGAKYPGGLALFTGCGGIWLYHRQSKYSWLGSVSVYTAFFALAYFATTPGTLLETRLFIKDLQTQAGVYSSGHFGYSVPVGPVHLARMLNYLGQVALSPYRVVAALLAGFAVYALVAQWRANRRQTLLLVLFPIGWLLFFCLLKVMIARNFQTVVPYVALLAARGIYLTGLRLGSLWAARASAVVFCSVVGANLVWLARDPLPKVTLGDLVQQLVPRSQSETWLSPAARRALLEKGAELPPTVDLSTANQLIFLIPSELGTQLHRLRANKPGRYETAEQSPQDTNLDFYPTWLGNDRPVLVDADQARADGLLEVLSRF